jgi:hypothetical protein
MITVNQERTCTPADGAAEAGAYPGHLRTGPSGREIRQQGGREDFTYDLEWRGL